MALAESAKALVNNLAENIWNEVFKFLKSNKEFLAGMGVGAALSTPAGKAMVARLGKDAKELSKIAEQYGKKAVSDAFKYAIDSKVGKTNLVEEASKSGSKVNKAVEIAAKVSAAKIGGEILGASLGNIATSKNFGEVLLHANPVGMTVDAVKESIAFTKEKSAKKANQKKAAEEIVKAIQDEGARLQSQEEALMTGKQVVEYERSKANKSTAGATTSDMLAKFMKSKGKITNHPIWYGKYREYVTSNLQWGERKESLGFPTAAGTQLTISLMIPTANGQVSQAFKDAVNMIYVKMRGSNSGAFNYDAVDVAAYLECNRSIRALHSQLCRDLKLVNNVDPYIIQTPDIMLSIAGYDASGIADIKANRISYINELNQLKAVIENRYPLPPDMAVFDRAEYLATAIIEEGKGPKSSVFIYHLGALTTTKANGTRELDLVSADVASFATKLAILRTMIENCEQYATSYGPSTFAKIAGDLMKAYGNAAFRNAASINIDDKAVVAYDAYLLTQIQNGVGAQIARSEPTMATYTDAFTVTYTRDVRLEAKTGETATVPANRIYGVIDSTDSSIDLIMNCYKKEITGLEVLSLTRLVDYIKVDTTTVTPNTVLTAAEYECGTEIINRIRMFIFDPTKPTGTDRYSIGSHMREATDSDAIVSVWSQIDYSPTLQIFSNANNNGDFVNILDLDVYAHMTKRQFSIFTTTCVLSLYKTVSITDQVNFKAVKK